MPVGPFGMFEEYISSCFNGISAVTRRVGDVDFDVVILKRFSCDRIVDPFSGTLAHADSESEMVSPLSLDELETLTSGPLLLMQIRKVKMKILIDGSGVILGARNLSRLTGLRCKIGMARLGVSFVQESM